MSGESTSSHLQFKFGSFNVKRFLLPLILICLFVASPFALAQGGGTLPAAQNSSPEAVVRGFYRWYLRNLNNDNFTPLKQRTTALKYLTPALLVKAPRLTRQMNADIFICAQDFDPEWEKNITLSETRTQGSKASTTVTLRGAEVGNSSIKIGLKRLNAGWRIDSVECVFED